MRAGFFSLSPFRLPHYLNGSIGSLNIGAFSIFFNTFGYFGCDNDRNDSMSYKRQGWKSQQEGLETDGTERRDWLALVLASGLRSGRQNRCVFPRPPDTMLEDLIHFRLWVHLCVFLKCHFREKCKRSGEMTGQTGGGSLGQNNICKSGALNPK